MVPAQKPAYASEGRRKSVSVCAPCSAESEDSGAAEGPRERPSTSGWRWEGPLLEEAMLEVNLVG